MKIKNFNFYVLLGFFVIGFFIFYVAAHENPKGTLRISYVSIGNGQVIFIESPTGNKIVINGGSNDTILSVLGKQLSFYDRNIDALFLTDLNAKDATGIPVILKQYHVSEYFSGGIIATSSIFLAIQKNLIERKVRTNIAYVGEIIDIGGGAYIKILAANPMILQVVYDEKSFLLTPNSQKK